MRGKHYHRRQLPIRKYSESHWHVTVHPNGSITGMIDKDGNPIYSGDIIQLEGTKHGPWNTPRIGRVFLIRYNNRDHAEFCYNICFAPFDEFNYESYGKNRDANLDNGGRMMLTKLGDYTQKITELGLCYS